MAALVSVLLDDDVRETLEAAWARHIGLSHFRPSRGRDGGASCGGSGYDVRAAQLANMSWARPKRPRSNDEWGTPRAENK